MLANKFDEDDHEKTAITSHHGLYGFMRMPFGLRKRPYDRLECDGYDTCLCRLTVCLLYLDFIVVFLKSRQDHTERFWCVLQLLYKARVTLNLKNSKFFAQTIDYYGHATRPVCFELAKHTTDSVAKLEHSTTQTELCTFPGLCSVFTRFVPNLALLRSPQQ